MRRAVLKLVFALSVTFVALSHDPCAAKPSFDCAKSKTTTEEMICGDAELADLDFALSKEYSKFKASLQEEDGLLLQKWQKEWLSLREVDCVTNSKYTEYGVKYDKLFCLKRAYKERIAHISEIRLPYKDGFLSYKIFDGHGRDRPPIEYVQELYFSVLRSNFPAFDMLRCEEKNKTNCPSIGPVSEKNTVVFEFSKGGTYSTALRYRTFLTATDRGSGEFTLPLCALDFEYRYEQQESAAYVTVSLTGFSTLDNSRLPPVPGLPEPSGCLGCE